MNACRYGPSPMFFLQGHTGCVNSALFSECGNYVFTGSDDTRVNVHNLHTGFLEESISTAHAGINYTFVVKFFVFY